MVVAVAVGDEQQIRSRPDPHAAEADFQSADEIEPFAKDFPRVEHAVAGGVFENDDLIPPVAARSAIRIGVSLGHPQSAFAVDRKSDRLMHLRLARREFDAEPLGHRHRFRGLLGRQSLGERVFRNFRGKALRAECHKKTDCQNRTSQSATSHRIDHVEIELKTRRD